MIEKIIACFIALTILAFFVAFGILGYLSKGESGKRLMPLPLGIICFTFGMSYYVWLILSVLIPILRR